MSKEIHGEAELTFFEATSIIVGHGVGSGILSVPFFRLTTAFAGIHYPLAGINRSNIHARGEICCKSKREHCV